MSREQVLAFRVRAQQLDREAGALDGTAVLDVGVQDSGSDGARWALACRGVPSADTAGDDLVLLWTLRGAPHLYLRRDLPGVARALAPFSEADAAKRVFDAAKPLRAAGVGVLEALDTVAAALREIVERPTVKGEVSGRLSERLPEPYLRHCRPCAAVHVHEMPFRLAAVRAGLELQPGTSPPVLQRVPGFAVAPHAPERLDVVRGYLRLLGPATPQHVAQHLDAPLAEVKARWPTDVVEVRVDGQTRSLLADDTARLLESRDARPPAGGPHVRLLAPFDLFLQARDRATLVPDAARAKALWPVLGRPGAVLVDGELVGLWRPRQQGRALRVSVEPWRALDTAARAGVEQQAERLAAHRGVRWAGVEGW